MPTYEYDCQQCGHGLEAFQRMSDDPLQLCPACGEPALKRRIGRGAGIIFKGGGFYETDFKSKKGAPPSEGAGAAESGGKDSGASAAKDSGASGAGGKESTGKDSGGSAAAAKPEQKAPAPAKAEG